MDFKGDPVGVLIFTDLQPVSLGIQYVQPFFHVLKPHSAFRSRMVSCAGALAVLHLEGQLFPVGPDPDPDPCVADHFAGAVLEAVFYKGKEKQWRDPGFLVFQFLLNPDLQSFAISELLQLNIVGNKIQFLTEGLTVTRTLIKDQVQHFGEHQDAFGRLF